MLMRGDGFYTRDPAFADFFREALALGYRPLAYEATHYDTRLSPNAQIASRERQEASNLFDHALRDRPDAKVLVYVGFSHVAERPIGRHGVKVAWMAARLKTLSGIDPVTIDQTAIRLPDPPVPEDDPLTTLLTPRLGTRSVIAMQGQVPLVLRDYAGTVDLQVIHPPAHVVEGRPDWLAAMGHTPVSYSGRLVADSGHAPDPGIRGKRSRWCDPARSGWLVSAGAKPPSLFVPARPSGCASRFRIRPPLPPIEPLMQMKVYPSLRKGEHHEEIHRYRAVRRDAQPGRIAQRSAGATSL